MEKVIQHHLRDDLPQGAVFVTRKEVLQYQLNLIDNWKPWTDIWPLHLGRTILAGAASISGVYINYRFRRRLRFLDHGSFPTTISLFVIPALLTAFVQGEIAPGSTVLNIPRGRDVKAVIKYIGSAYQPLLPVITLIFISHSLLAGFISYEQIKSFVYLQNAQYLLIQSEDKEDR